MKFEYYKSDDEKVIVYAKEKNHLIEEIEQLAQNSDLNIDGYNFYGYLEDDIVKLNLNDVERFYIEDNKTIATIGRKKYVVKFRIYELENNLNDSFIKINQSCIINKHKIKRFSVSFGGSLLVELNNGDIDYVSRRMTKLVKERMGL